MCTLVYIHVYTYIYIYISRFDQPNLFSFTRLGAFRLLRSKGSLKVKARESDSNLFDRISIKIVSANKSYR